jgi:hypothetical protein
MRQTGPRQLIAGLMSAEASSHAARVSVSLSGATGLLLDMEEGASDLKDGGTIPTRLLPEYPQPPRDVCDRSPPPTSVEN